MILPVFFLGCLATLAVTIFLSPVAGAGVVIGFVVAGVVAYFME